MKSEELQITADRNEMKGFYSRLTEMWAPQTQQHVHLKSSGGLETFTDKKSVMARWSKYFQKVFNVPGAIEPEALRYIQKHIVNTALDEKPTKRRWRRNYSRSMEIRESQFSQQTAQMDHYNMGKRTCTTSLEG